MESNQSSRGSLTTGYFWTFGSTALPLVSAFVVSLILARWMGPRVVGLINWTMALATIFLIPAKFGIEGAASRLISEYDISSPGKIRGLINSSILMRLLFTLPVGALVSAGAPLLSRFFGEQALLPLFRISGFLILAVSLNELAVFIVLGLRKFRFLFLVRVMMLVIRIGLVLVAVRFAFGEAGVLVAYIAAAFIPALIVYTAFLTTKRFPAGGERWTGSWERLFRLSMPLAISGASVTIYSLLDKLMLGYFGGASQVGLYSMARNLMETSLFPTFALVMTLRPALAGAWTSGDRKRCGDLVDRAMINSLFYSVCVVVVFACLSRPLVIGLYSEKFTESARILLLFMPLIVMRSIGAVILPGLIASDRAGTYAKLTLTGAGVNFMLNALLIPKWGADGAVISTLLSYLPIELLGLRALNRAMPGFWKKGNWSRVIKTLAAGGVLVFLYFRLAPEPGGIIPAVIHAFLLSIIFSAMLLAAKALTPAELRRILYPLIGRNNRS